MRAWEALVQDSKRILGARKLKVQENMRDGGVSEHERCWCMRAREMVLHESMRDGVT